MNANDKSNDSMDLLNALCPSWLAIGHTPRSDATHVYGSVMFDAAMDLGISALTELKDDGTLGVGLMVTKTNDTGRPPLRILAYEFDSYGLVRVREAQRHEFLKIEELQSGAPRTNGERIYDQILAFGKQTQDELVNDLGLNVGTVSREVGELVSSGKVAREKDGRRFVYYIPSKFDPQIADQNWAKAPPPKGGGRVQTNELGQNSDTGGWE